MSNHSNLRKSKPLPPLRSSAKARDWLVEQGLTVTQFARNNGLSVDAVKDLLLDRGTGRSGKSHDAAVALGMKRNPQMPAQSRATPRGR